MVFNWFKRKKDHTPETPSAAPEAGKPPEPQIQPAVSPPPPAEVRAPLPPSAASPAAEPPTSRQPVPPSLPPAPEPPLAFVSQPEAPPPREAAPESRGFFARLKKGLTKTRELLNTDIQDLFTGGRKIDDALLEELEERLITADLGVQTTEELIQRLRKKASGIADADAFKAALKTEIQAVLEKAAAAPSGALAARPHVIMVVGVNGTGKTTTVGKLAAMHRALGRKVLIAAADTFRAAAIEQLAIWAERAGADIVRHQDGSDPAAVAFDAVQAAMARQVDVLLVDTAGRLHTKINLMEELKKIHRTIAKQMAGAPHEILLVLDATTGQNAVSQARLFHEALGVTGIALTKLDGTAKGGIVVSIGSGLKIPLRYIGVGESLEDLQEFDPQGFADALF
jgi:fused signal recognition particle receptor